MQAMSSLIKQLIKVFLHRTFLLVAHQKQNARASQKMFRLAILSLLPHKVESAVVVIVVDVIVVAAVAVAADAASAVVAVAAAVTVAALHPDIKISAQRVPVSFFTLSRLFLRRIFKTLVSVSAFFRFARSGPSPRLRTRPTMAANKNISNAVTSSHDETQLEPSQNRHYENR